MDFRLTPDQESFRQDFVRWLKKNVPDDFDPSCRRNYETDEELKEAIQARA